MLIVVQQEWLFRELMAALLLTILLHLELLLLEKPLQVHQVRTQELLHRVVYLELANT